MMDTVSSLVPWKRIFSLFWCKFFCSMLRLLICRLFHNNGFWMRSTLKTVKLVVTFESLQKTRWLKHSWLYSTVMMVFLHVAWNLSWTSLYSAVPAARLTMWHEVFAGMTSQCAGMSSSVDTNNFWGLASSYRNIAIYKNPVWFVSWKHLCNDTKSYLRDISRNKQHVCCVCVREIKKTESLLLSLWQ